MPNTPPHPNFMYAYFIFVQFSQNQTLHLPIFNAFLRCQKQILRAFARQMVVLLYSDISNFSFWSVNILKYLDFILHFKKCKKFLHFTATNRLFFFGFKFKNSSKTCLHWCDSYFLHIRFYILASGCNVSQSNIKVR